MIVVRCKTYNRSLYKPKVFQHPIIYPFLPTHASLYYGVVESSLLAYTISLAHDEHNIDRLSLNLQLRNSRLTTI